MRSTGKYFWLVSSRILSFTLFINLVACQVDEKHIIEWSFMASDRIQSTPVIDKTTVYFGSNDSIFYAVNSATGKEIWRFKTGHKTRSNAIIKDSIVFFTSGNNLFALNKNTGKEIWLHLSSDTTGSAFFDPWDYHTSSPILHDSKVFSGFGNGILLGFDLVTGFEEFRFNSLDSSAIRSTPVVNNDVIYFGDWNGIIYAVDLNLSDTLWTYKTYDLQPYPTFGQINTRMVVYDTILLFGARNPEIQALNIQSGKQIWSHIETDGGWISGDPVVQGDTLFIGASDSHKLFAFNVYTGEIYWEYEFLFNNFSKPLIDGNTIYLTTGDAYAFAGNNFGNGYLYALDKNNGAIINMTLYEGNMFNSPVLNSEKILIAGDDKKLRTIDQENFLNPSTTFIRNGNGPFDIVEVTNDTLLNHPIVNYTMYSTNLLTIRIYNFEGSQVRMLFSGTQSEGRHTIIWDGNDQEENIVPDGYYIISLKSDIFIKNVVVLFNNQM